MATTGRPSPAKGMPSPRTKGREAAKDTLCRNVTIYGHCRYEDKGCAFNHDPIKAPNSQAQAETMRKRLNVDSPSFTPSILASNGTLAQKSKTISPKAAVAAPFMPKNIASSQYDVQDHSQSTRWQNNEPPEFVPQSVPQSFEAFQMPDSSNISSSLSSFDPFAGATTAAIQGSHTGQGQQINPYAQDESIGASGYYQGQESYTQPLNYHLYAPLGPHRENLLAYQRTVHDYFISDSIREELQRKSDASRQVLPNSTLPQQIDYFHSLVPLDTSHVKSIAAFGYPSWIYKAVSAKDGNLYALRRLEGYRLTNERAIRAVQNWKKIDSAGIVTVHDAFTSRAFGDSSLIFVTDYYPLAKTLADEYFMPSMRQQRQHLQPVPERVLWSYMVQLGSALKTIHENGLAARLIDASKILLTGKNRIRLNGCAILDVIQHDAFSNIEVLQQEDLEHLGRLILVISLRNPLVTQEITKAMDHMARIYTPKLNEVLTWLLTPHQSGYQKKIGLFLEGMGSQTTLAFDEALHQNDQLTLEINRELENARVTRLMMKLNYINERPEFEHDRQWSESGDRYCLKLFRDYVFHQVDSQGNPVIDITHVLTCLAKLDVGIDEKINLISRDEQNCIVVTYRELKRAIESAFQDLQKASRPSQQ